MLCGAEGKNDMRLMAICFCFLIGALSSAYGQSVDYSQYARPERKQLAKCFMDIESVVKRHGLRKHLLEFLEAGCRSEMNSYKQALKPFVLKDPTMGDMAKSAIMMESFVTMFTADMEETAERLYKQGPVPFCSDGTCPVEAYRKCLLLKMSDAVSKRIEPIDFEKKAQRECIVSETEARSVLIIDFGNAQKLQADPHSNPKTRDLIEEAITDTRHETVVAYADQLASIVPGRKSCRPQLCGDTPCISLDDDNDPEYTCAIGKSER
jgi:hypothetical protein